MNLTNEQIEERVAILKRFKSLLQEQRNKFQEYLNVLEKQQNKIELDDADAIVAHAELETQIVANITSLQKVIVPMQKMYNSVMQGHGIPITEGMSVEKMQADLAKLQTRVLHQNEKNRNLLKNHMELLKAQLTTIQNKNPYRTRTSIYSEKGTVAIGNSFVFEA